MWNNGEERFEIAWRTENGRRSMVTRKTYAEAVELSDALADNEDHMPIVVYKGNGESAESIIIWSREGKWERTADKHLLTPFERMDFENAWDKRVEEGKADR